jgi:hypothetical protein
MDFGLHLQRPVSVAEATELRRLGLAAVTVPLSWRWAETRAGAWDTASIDHFLAPLREARVPLQGALGPAFTHLLPQHVVDSGSADAAGFEDRFAAANARLAAACPDIGLFRVEEALNGAWLWDGLRTRRRRGKRWRDRGFRDAILASTLSAVRQARPDAELRVTVDTNLPRWRTSVRRWQQAGIRFDRLGLRVDPSRLLPDPRMASRVGDVVAQAQKVFDGAVEVSHVVYPTHTRSFSPRHQREFLVAAAASAQEAGAAGLHWGPLRDQAWPDPMLGYWMPERERHCGLAWYDGTPKAALDELRVLATGDRFGEGA